MTQQMIGVGSAANDGTGDPLRGAFQKLNAMMLDLYGRTFPGYIAGRWYVPGFLGSSTTSTIAVNAIRLHPILIQDTITIDQLGTVVVVAEAGKNIQLAIYANNPTANKPTGTPLASTASISASGTGAVFGAITPVQLKPGLYWVGRNSDTAGTLTTVTFTNTHVTFSALLGSTTQGSLLASNSSLSGYSIIQTFGTWADLTSASLTETLGSAGTTIVEFHVSSVP